MCSFISLIIQFIIYCCQVRCKNNLLPVIIYKNTGTKRDLPMKTFHHRDTQQRTEDWLSSDTAEIWHMTLLNCSLLVFSVLSGNKEMEKPKDFFSHPHTHFFFLISTNMPTISPVELRAGLSVAYKKLLENSLLQFFFLRVFPMCMWVCVCTEKKMGKKWKCACVYTVCEWAI